MKHHKVKGVWKHRPDALPLPDTPSTGAKRKRGPLAKASKKHLWDKLHQMRKELFLHGCWLWLHQSPSGWFDTNMAMWTHEAIEKTCTKMDEVLKELEGR